MALAVTRPDHRRGRVAAVREAAAETRVHPDVHEHPARPQHAPTLGQHGRVGRHIGVHHHGDDRVHAAVPHWQPLRIRAGDGHPLAPVPQHPGRQVDTDGRPLQLAHHARVDACATPDLEAHAGPLAEQLPQRGRDPEPIRLLLAQELPLVSVHDLGVRRLHKPQWPARAAAPATVCARSELRS
ncbi:hypothetical protein QRX50_13230 [Amycolatopsis carbonis]|uniref:Uncharacterized protein n=1 Tax=Amycolatopsis carbonis TaxID=715471 RepID=A0A9Y2ILU8_9PSEU|nr:hypothetical protein [Amycolatopsis sp. 2-15]WIX81646.1 hypothetical protein QRX50_13230 [Amycolatopsis sp. 2-15]